MYEVKIISEFHSAHRLRNYKGKCENLHGHNWKVEVSVESPVLDKNGFVIDFIDLKKITNDFLKKLDHKVLNSLPFFKRRNPSAEHIARLIFDAVSQKLPHGLGAKSVAVWETGANCAIYSES